MNFNGDVIYDHPMNRLNNEPFHPEQGRFSSGLFDCFSDVPSCICSTFFDCLQFGRVAQRIGFKLGTTEGKAKWSIALFFLRIIPTFLGMMALFILLAIKYQIYFGLVQSIIGLSFGFVVLYLYYQLLQHFKQTFAIYPQNDCFCDVLKVWCCGCCVLSQMSRHLNLTTFDFDAIPLRNDQLNPSLLPTAQPIQFLKEDDIQKKEHMNVVV